MKKSMDETIHFMKWSSARGELLESPVLEEKAILIASGGFQLKLYTIGPHSNLRAGETKSWQLCCHLLSDLLTSGLTFLGALPNPSLVLCHLP